MTRITKKLFLKAIKNSGGNQSRVGDRMEVTRSAVGHFLKKNPDMREAMEDEAERYIDICEDNLTTSVMVHGDVDNSFKVLTTSKRGKARGWGVKQEVEHVGDIPITINLITKSNEEIKKAKGVIENASN